MDKIAKSRKLAFLLRHDTNYAFDKHGWRTIDDLTKNHGFTLEQIKEIVRTNNKNRYELSADGRLIRASQGHSVDVDVELTELTPPDILYHGTARESVDSIFAEGIKSGTRLYVHLSDTVQTAISVGQRHGTPVVLMVNAKQMSTDGYVFYLSKNGVWLTAFVPAVYLEIIESSSSSLL